MNLPSTLSISVVSYASSTELLRNTLNSLAVAVNQAKTDDLLSSACLVICDNGPNQKDYDQISKIIADTKIYDVFDSTAILSGHGNIGFGRGHNMAFATVESNFHLVLNPDVLLDPSALSEGLQYLNIHPEVSLLSPSAIWPNGNRQCLCKRYPALFDLLLRGFAPEFIRGIFHRRLKHFEMHDVCNTEPVIGVPITSGCFMLARSEKFSDIGGFSEKYFLYFEDFDFSIRMNNRGLMAYVPAVKIVHYGGHAARKGWRHIAMFARSAMIFYRQHGWKIL